MESVPSHWVHAAGPGSRACDRSRFDQRTIVVRGTDLDDRFVNDSERPAATTSTTTTDVVEGFHPRCVESTNDRSHFRLADEAALDTFGPLATEPAMRITLPLGRSTEVPELQASGVSVAPIPGGALLAVVARGRRWLRPDQRGGRRRVR